MSSSMHIIKRATIFAEKNVRTFCTAKVPHNFSEKKMAEFLSAVCSKF